MIKFDKIEIRDIVIASVFMGFAFSLFNVNLFVYYFFLAVIFVFVKIFVAKLVAERYNAKSYFKVWPAGLVITAVLSFFKLPVMLVGTTETHGYKFGRWKFRQSRLNVKDIAVVSFVSLVAVMVLSAAFYLLNIRWAAVFGSWFLLSSLIPVKNFDGEKMIKWDPGVWVTMVILSILMIVFWM